MTRDTRDDGGAAFPIQKHTPRIVTRLPTPCWQ